MKYKVTRPQRLKSAILQNLHENIGKFSEHEREFNLNADKKRLWLRTLKNLTEKTKNRSYPLSPQIFPKAFELNDDFEII